MAKIKGVCNDCGGLISSCHHTDPEPFGDERDGAFVSKAVYHLLEREGKAVQEILNRYVSEELRPALEAIENTNGGSIAEEASIVGLTKDIDYITGLAKLFD